MTRAPGLPWLRAAVGAVAAVLSAVIPVAATPPTRACGAVRLTGLGDGTALIMGGSGIPLPTQGYVDAATMLYLQPHGFTGTPQALFTPAGFYPTTGIKSLPAFVSETQGAQMLSETVLRQIAGGQVDAANPVVVFGYSQSSALSSLAMAQLAEQGVPADDVHFVLVGDTAAPNGGLLERFDVPLGSHPEIPSMGITFGYPTPDLYPADVYTLEYDGFADFPQYTLNPLAVLNAMAGMVLEHFTYLGLQPDQIANAIPLPTAAADSLTHYFVIPQDHLPLLDLVRFLPFIGNPLADLVEPAMKILVNLGYGSITEGWSQGPADVETPFGLFPPDLDWGEVLDALLKAIPEGIVAVGNDLLDPRNYDVFASIADNPATGPLLRAAYAVGDLTTNPAAFLDNPSLATFTQVLNALDLGSSGAPSEGYAQLLPLADMFTALTVTLPAYNLTVFLDQLESGNLIEAIGLPIAADMALIPIALALGLGLGGGL
ncbi:PE-PPE domain-containing protein [[Mycobacterium] crassicus]|uniref:PE-PPE domain-containing protein n=1 Tax=[Mycobacterium] crassicus TaxID=2872309 RepID=A0ABU5XHS8_9MYCO|nr:PE-PPE domain-containing protein [Mycolicibacter sp. MYC098]MEB3021848.1 PE-PPE domain-containing protein [Mycolicibacter sp. MYC098]